MEGATIALPGNGEPIASIEISGSKHPLLPCRLSLGAGNRWLAKKWLLRTHWKMTVRPDYTCKSPAPIRLSLQFLGFRQRIGIDALTITTITPGSKEQPREIISRIPGNPYWAKDESIVFGEIFAHPRRLRWLNFSGGEPLINPVFPVILERLVESGHAEHIGLYITSNGTVHSQRLSELLKQFRCAHRLQYRWHRSAAGVYQAAFEVGHRPPQFSGFSRGKCPGIRTPHGTGLQYFRPAGPQFDGVTGTKSRSYWTTSFTALPL